MNIVTHVLKKDIRRTRGLLAIWLLLLALQFVLIGSSANPGDRLMQALYSTLSWLVPMFQLLVLIVIVPHVIQDEPLVGTTAFWFTRPISRRDLLASKALFAAAVLIIPPLVAEIIVLAANGATGHDLLLAAPEIVMQQAASILAIAILAVVTPNFGRFAIVGAAAIVAGILVQLAIFWISLYLNPTAFLYQASEYSITQSRSVTGSLILILAATALVAHQYLTRNTIRTILGIGVALALIIAAEHFWPWDFMRPSRSSAATDPGFNSAAITVSLEGFVNSNDIPNFRGQGLSAKNIRGDIETEGVPKGYVTTIKEVRAHLTAPDGKALAVEKAQEYDGFQTDGDALEFALGGIPVLNAQRFGSSGTALFSIDANTYHQYSSTPLKLSATIDYTAKKYIVTAELPLAKGARYDHGSEHVVITDVLSEPDGVDIVLRQRRLHLLFDLQENHSSLDDNGKVVYLLLNRTRREAVLEKQQNSVNVNFQANSQRLINQPLSLSFGQEENSSALVPELTPAWLADAVLARLELVPAATFSKDLTVDPFRLYGSLSSRSSYSGRVMADRQTLDKITLPPNPTKQQVRDYIDAIMVASRKQNSWSDRDYQAAMLTKVGPENLDVLLDYDNRFHDSGAELYFSGAIRRVARPEDEALILQSLASDHNLADLVETYGWQSDARGTLVAGLNPQNPYLPISWIKAVASLRDPSTYPALESYLLACSNKPQTFDAIRRLPGIDLTDSVNELWTKGKYGNSFAIMNVAPIAAEYGHADALDAAASILKKETNTYDLRRARQLIQKFTTATGDDAALISWVESKRGKLVFDKPTGKFLPLGFPPSP